MVQQKDSIEVTIQNKSVIAHCSNHLVSYWLYFSSSYMTNIMFTVHLYIQVLSIGWFVSDHFYHTSRSTNKSFTGDLLYRKKKSWTV